MKRVFDVVLSLLVLVLLSPVLVAAALATLIDSGAPVLHRQIRIGRGGCEFGMYKFRSMVKNAASIGPYFTSGDDPRITRVGRLLRRTSIDELPQLFNVLNGDMSLVGPRPDVPQQCGLYAAEQWTARCAVRPGITGLAQVLYRSDATAEQRLEADLRYAREAGVWLDLKIIGWTLGRLSGKGAN